MKRLKLQRRHVDCDAGHLYGYTSVDNDSKKGWKRCKCIIYACGTLAKKHKRISTDETVEDRAQVVAAKYAAAGTWDINPAPLPPMTPPSTTKQMTDGRDEVNRAIKGFLAELADDGSAEATLKKYRLVLGKLRAYAADQGYTRLDAFTNLVVRDMRTGWNVSARTADKNMSTVKSLFDYAVTEGFIEFNPARIKKRKNRATRQLDARHEQREPFSDPEIERMYAACRNEYGQGSKIVEFKSTLGKQFSYVIDIAPLSGRGPVRTSKTSSRFPYGPASASRMWRRSNGLRKRRGWNPGPYN